MVEHGGSCDGAAALKFGDEFRGFGATFRQPEFAQAGGRSSTCLDLRRRPEITQSRRVTAWSVHWTRGLRDVRGGLTQLGFGRQQAHWLFRRNETDLVAPCHPAPDVLPHPSVVRPNPARNPPKPTPNRSTPDKHWLSLSEFGATSIEFGPTLMDPGPTLEWPTLVESRPACCAQIRHKLRPTSTGVGPISAKLGPTSAPPVMCRQTCCANARACAGPLDRPAADPTDPTARPPADRSIGGPRD